MAGQVPRADAAHGGRRQPFVGRRGRVRITDDGQIVKDDTGEWTPLVYSDFQAANYRRSGQLAERDGYGVACGYSARRSFSHLAWDGYEIGPHQGDFWQNWFGTLREGFTLGVRTSITHGDFDTELGRRNFADFAAVRAFFLKEASAIRDAGLIEAILGYEICNEIENRGDWGGNWRWSLDQARKLAREIRAILGPQVWVSAAADDSEAEINKMAPESDAIAVHLPRRHPDPNAKPWEGEYRHSRQGRGVEEHLPSGKRWYNQEPGGPQTSQEIEGVGAMVAVAAASIMTSAVATCYHSRHGTGNRGYMRLQDAKGFREVGLLSRILPVDLPRWSFKNHTDAGHPFDVEAVGDVMGTLDGSKRGCVRAFARSRGNDRFVHFMEIPRACRWVPRRAMRIEWIKAIVTGATEPRLLSGPFDVSAGQAMEIGKIENAFILGAVR